MSEMRFKNKKVIITGAGSGIGRATAQLYAEEGADVFGIDIDEVGLKETSDQTNIKTGTFDISNQSGCAEAVAAAEKALSGIDILANIAGIFKTHSVENVDEASWNRIINVNLSGTFWMSQAAIPHLLKSGGNIVNVASTAGLMGQAYTVPYCASKGGVILLTQAMAMEYAKTGLRVNAVAPGGVDTPIAQNFEMPEGADMDLIGRYTGFRGLAVPADIAKAIAFLSSDEAHRIHGEILRVDAGLASG